MNSKSPSIPRNDCFLIYANGVTPHGVNEVRVLVSGSYAIAGCPITKAPGSNLIEKVSMFTNAQKAQAFVTSVKNEAEGYWAIEHNTVGSLVVVPAGHLIIVCGAPESGSFFKPSSLAISR